MTNPYPLPRETRETSIISGDGRATYGPFGFRIWDVADVVARVARGSGSFRPEAVAASKTSGEVFSPFSVTFTPALGLGDRAIVQSRRLHERSTDVTRGGAISTNGLEGELSRQGTVLQELRRDTDENYSSDAALQAQLDADEAARAQVIELATSEAARSEEAASSAQQSATQAAAYALMVGAAAYDFAQDSDPDLPGYDWSVQ